MPRGIYKHKKGYKRPEFSEEWKENMSKAMKGRIPWNKGKKGLQVGWNKGTKGIMKLNSGSFKRGENLGNKNINWKGQNASYGALHYRVSTKMGKPKYCKICKTKNKNIRYEWANINHNYLKIKNYKRMCVKCHRDYDKKRRKQNGKTN